MQLYLLHFRRFLFYFSLWFTIRVIGFVLLSTRDEVVTFLYQPVTYVIALVIAVSLVVYQYYTDKKANQQASKNAD